MANPKDLLPNPSLTFVDSSGNINKNWYEYFIYWSDFSSTTSEDATTTSKGIASFAADDFTVVSGAVSIDDKFLLNTGDAGTGNYNFKNANEFLIPTSDVFSASTQGALGLDSNISGYTGLLKYYDGTLELAAIAIPSSNLSSTTDNSFIEYNSGTSRFELSDPRPVYQIYSNNSEGTVAAGGTVYIGGNGQKAAETDAQYLSGINLSQATLKVRADAAAGSGQSFTYTLRKNGVDTGAQVVLSGVAATTGSDPELNSISEFDKLSVSLTTSASAAVTRHYIAIVGVEDY